MNVPLHILIPADLMAQLKLLAERRGECVAVVVRSLVREAVQEQE